MGPREKSGSTDSGEKLSIRSLSNTSLEPGQPVIGIVSSGSAPVTPPVLPTAAPPPVPTSAVQLLQLKDFQMLKGKFLLEFLLLKVKSCEKLGII